MHAILSYRGNRPTNTHTHTNPQTGPITIHCPTASLQCKNCLLISDMVVIYLGTLSHLKAMTVQDKYVNVVVPLSYTLMALQLNHLHDCIRVEGYCLCYCNCLNSCYCDVRNSCMSLVYVFVVVFVKCSHGIAFRFSAIL